MNIERPIGFGLAFLNNALFEFLNTVKDPFELLYSPTTLLTPSNPIIIVCLHSFLMKNKSLNQQI